MTQGSERMPVPEWIGWDETVKNLGLGWKIVIALCLSAGLLLLIRWVDDWRSSRGGGSGPNVTVHTDHQSGGANQAAGRDINNADRPGRPGAVLVAEVSTGTPPDEGHWGAGRCTCGSRVYHVGHMEAAFREAVAAAGQPSRPDHPLTWTTDPPTAPGWWLAWQGDARGWPKLVLVAGDTGGLWWYHGAELKPIESLARVHARWAGPLVPPEG